MCLLPKILKPFVYEADLNIRIPDFISGDIDVCFTCVNVFDKSSNVRYYRPNSLRSARAEVLRQRFVRRGEG